MRKKAFLQAKVTAIVFLIVGIMDLILAFLSQSTHFATVTAVFTIMGIFFLLGSMFYFFRYRYHLKGEQRRLLPKDEQRTVDPLQRN